MALIFESLRFLTNTVPVKGKQLLFLGLNIRLAVLIHALHQSISLFRNQTELAEKFE